MTQTADPPKSVGGSRDSRPTIAQAALTPLVGQLRQLIFDVDGAIGGAAMPQIAADGAALVEAGEALERQFANCVAALPAAFTGQADLSALRHDLRTPLNAVGGYADLIADDLIDAGPSELSHRIEDLRAGLAALIAAIDTHLQLGGQDGDGDVGDAGQITAHAPRSGEVGRILVVDDNASNRSLLCERLLREGHSVVLAEDGQSALDRLAEGGIDLVLLDDRLPDMPGSDVLVAMRTRPDTATLPVLMISAGGDVKRIAACIDLGAEDYLSKPFHPRLLRSRIGAALERRRLREAEALDWAGRLQAVLDMAVDGMVILAADGTIEQANAVAERVFAVPVGALAGASLARYVLGWPAEGGPDAWLARQSRADAAVGVTRELTGRRADGTAFPLELSLRAARQGERRLFAITLRDITARRAAEARRAWLASHDSVTELLNRNRFGELLDEALDEGAAGAVLSVTAPTYREAVDQISTEASWDLLRRLADRLRPLMRPGWHLARLTGDEFAILAPGLTETGETTALLGQVIERIAMPVRADGIDLALDPLAAATFFPSQGTSAQHLMRNLDLALQEARGARPQPICLFHEDIRQRVRARRSLERDLRAAIREGQLSLYYQPKVDLVTREIIGVEALARWHHPQRGMVPPTLFVPLAESTGTILGLGAWVLRRACSDLAEWRRQGNAPPAIAVNVSALQLKRQDILALAREALAECDLPSDSLEIELTESAVMDDAKQAAQVLGRLRDGGMRIAIDDFGTGYSSLSYLHALPLDSLKIDRSFVSRMSEDQASRGIVATILSLARALRLSVIAEGIETEREAQMLQALGCGYGQGYLFGKAAPPPFTPLPLVPETQ